MSPQPAARRRAAPSRKRETLSGQLRKAAASSGYTDNALAVLAGVDPTGLGRFMKGERDWTMATADKLAEVLGLELVPVRGRAAAPRPAPRRAPLPRVVTAAELVGGGEEEEEEAA